MRLYEAEAKGLLQHVGVPVPRGDVVHSAAAARDVAERLGGQVVIKAQLLRGGRMKAGLIRFADDLAATEREAEDLLGATRAQQGAGVLVEERALVSAEYFLGVLYGADDAAPILVLSEHGGIDVEGVARQRGVQRMTVDPRIGAETFRIRELVHSLGARGKRLRSLTAIAERAVRLFLEYDATLVEINPLGAVDDGDWLALDSHVALDDDAVFRQRELVARLGLENRGDSPRLPTKLERQARAIDELDHRGVAGRLVEFDGDLALLIGGGGASLTVFDSVRAAHGRPANYCEVGGNPSVRKVAELTRLLLDNGARKVAVVMNVVSNTRADLIARGVIAGCLDADRDPRQTIAVFRVPGAWERESRELLADYGIRYLDRGVSLDEAAELAVATLGEP